MIVVILLSCLYLLIPETNAQVNLALNKDVTMSSVEVDREGQKSVDGDTSQSYSDDSCSSTMELAFDKIAWWQVDLGGISSISKIHIYFRNENTLFRFSGFQVWVSNEPNRIPADLCYTDNNGVQSNTGTVSVFTVTSCNKTGRYVTISKDRSGSCTPGSTNKNLCTILEICEVQVSGCQNNMYGSNCNTPCPDNCKDGVCNVDTGFCTECIDGYTGGTCVTACTSGKYGAQCSLSCGHCRDSNGCNNVNGTCVDGCQDGWNGTLCNDTCNPGYYGRDCGHVCGQCDGTCYPVNGTCSSGCIIGWTGLLCDIKVKCNVTEIESEFSHHNGPDAGEVEMNETVSFVCNAGYNATNGDVDRTCTGYGNWTGEPLNCSLCRCSCKNYISIDDIEALIAWEDEMKKELTYNPKSTTKYKRTKTSAPDERMVSKTLGISLGIGLLSAVAALLFLPDLPKIFRDVWYGQQ